jgi:hypothetical protein
MQCPDSFDSRPTRGKSHPEIATMMDNAVRGKRKATKKPTK